MTQTKGNMKQENQEEVIVSFGKTELPYAIPQGYFDTFAEDMLSLVRMEAYPKQSVFSVPEGYFDSFADTVLQRVKNESPKQSEVLEELKDIAPLLTTISRENVYTVPAGYFEQFSVNTNGAKLVSINKNNKKNTWKGLAVAASLLFAVLTLGLVVNNNDNDNIATTQTSQIQNYASAGTVEIDSAKPNAQSTKGYLNNPAIQNEVSGPKVIEPQKMNVINVSQEINAISSKDLEEYLNSTPAIN